MEAHFLHWKGWERIIDVLAGMTDSNELDGSEISSMIEIDYTAAIFGQKAGAYVPLAKWGIEERKGYEFHWAP
jgi:hypothetical protein